MHLAVRDAVRRFVDEQVKPNVDELEHGDTPPYDIIRKMFTTFGLDQLARDGFKRALERKVQAEAAAGGGPADTTTTTAPDEPRRTSSPGGDPALTLIPIIEL